MSKSITQFLYLEFHGMELWVWAALIGVFIAATIISWVANGYIQKLSSQVLYSAKIGFGKRSIAKLTRPLIIILIIALFAAGNSFLPLTQDVGSYVSKTENVLWLIAIIWFAFGLTDIIISHFSYKMEARQPGVAKTVMPAVSKVIKITLGIVFALFALQNFGVNVGALLAGLGIGGLAIALAGQKSLENFFGGVMVVLDQPARVGDYCKAGDIEGTVEDIGLRSVKIRTLDRTVVTIPNSEFSQLQIENYAKRDQIRLNMVVGLIYDTSPDQMRYLLVELRRMLFAHPMVSEDPARVRFINFGASSLDIEIRAYVKTSDYNEFLKVQEDVFLRIMEIVDGSGSSFAFPSQTLYLSRDSGVNAELQGKAEAQVKNWRDNDEMYLPDFPEEEIQRTKDTLDFPPKGSAVRKTG